MHAAAEVKSELKRLGADGGEDLRGAGEEVHRDDEALPKELLGLLSRLELILLGVEPDHELVILQLGRLRGYSELLDLRENPVSIALGN